MTIDLEGMEKRAKAATLGPWAQGLNYEDIDGFKCGYVNTAKDTIAKTDSGESRLDAWSNAEFIAHARDDIPALITELRRLQSEREGAELKYAWLRSEAILRGAFKDGRDIDYEYDHRRALSAPQAQGGSK